MPTRFWQVPHLGLTAHSAILTARRTVCHTAPLRNAVPLLASPRPDASYRKYSASVRPHLPVSSPFRIAATRKHSALHRVYQPLLPSAPLCSPLLRAATTCAIPLRVRKVPIRKNRTGRPDVHIVVRTLRSPETGSFPHSPLEDRSATIRRPPHRHKKKRPHNVRAPCPMLREKRSVAEKITSRYRS